MKNIMYSLVLNKIKSNGIYINMNVALFLEIKNEYTEHLVDTLTPYVYEGLNSIYKEAAKIAETSNCSEKTLLIFQKLLQSVNGWNQIKIEDETNRIKQLSNTSDYLDKLVKAVIKSNIILLSYSNSVSNIIAQTFYNNLTTSTFVHRCYTECAKDAHNNPYLFYHDILPMDLKRNQIIVQQNIQSGITRAIRKILPISMILEEYLVNSVNIIQEPQKIELVGVGTQPIVADPMAPQEVQIKPTGTPAQASEKKKDAALEKQVMKLLSETKSDKDKIQAIMNLDKIISNIQPTRPAEMSAKISSSKKTLSNISKQKERISVVAPNLFEDEGEEDDDFLNDGLNGSDRKVLNINFDEEPTVNTSNKKSLSGTTLTNGPVTRNANAQRLYETSEKIDPSKIKLIEDYGSQIGAASKKHLKYN